MNDPANVLAELRRCLENLALDPVSQVRYLESLGPVSVDELGLEFHDALLMSWVLLQTGTVVQDSLAPARVVDRLLDRISGPENAALWTEDALAHRSEWAEIRRAAQAALAALSR